MEIKEFVEKFKERLKEDCGKKGKNCEICKRTNKIIDDLSKKVAGMKNE